MTDLLTPDDVRKRLKCFVLEVAERQRRVLRNMGMTEADAKESTSYFEKYSRRLYDDYLILWDRNKELEDELESHRTGRWPKR